MTAPSLPLTRLKPLQATSFSACIVLGIALAAAWCGCATKLRPATTSADLELSGHQACSLLRGAPQGGGTIVVALTDSVAPDHAPAPRNESERLVFRHLYETLITADCAGRPAPGLAESWSHSDRGRVWIFTLRAGARFWDGTPVLPMHVKLSWMSNQTRDPDAGQALPWIWLDARTDSAVTALDERRLSVSLATPLGDSPAFFAHPALAVAERRPDETWPIGTGPCCLADGAGRPEPDLVCLPVDDRGEHGASAWAQLVFRVRPGRDLRDLHAEGVDALLARDRAALGYFATAAGFSLIALPSDRVYLLLSPAAAGGDSSHPIVDPSGRGELARDVVASDAQPAASALFVAAAGDTAGGDIGGTAGDPCPPSILSAMLSASAGTGGNQSRIIYLDGDADARRLAERLAALAAMSALRDSSLAPIFEASPPPVAAALEPTEFAAALQTAGESAYILRLERGLATDCLQLATLLQAAEWLKRRLPAGAAGLPASAIADHLERTGAALPLVATRPHLVARNGLAGVHIDFDGTLRFDRAGWAAGRDGTVAP